MKDRLLKQAGHEYNPKQRMIFLLCLVPVFLFLLPYFFLWLGQMINDWLGFGPILDDPLHWIFGLLLTVPGFLLAWWSIYSQFTIGRGTPVPLMATQKLIVQPPFTYCRNPMTLGTAFAYLGISVLFHSLGAALVVLLFLVALLVYIKRVEEKEMELRFGAEYLAYKQRTPFLIPHIWKK